MRRTYCIGVLIGCILIGCTPTQVASVPTATLQGPVVPTRAPTTTLSATDTSEPTNTPVPTDTPTDTVVPSEEPSNTPTNTASPEPSETQTERPSDTPQAPDTAEPTETSEPTNTSQTNDTPTATNTPATAFTPSATAVGGSRYANSTALLPFSIESAASAFNTISSTVDANAPLHLYSYTGVVGEVLNITMRSTSGDLDPFLLMIDPKGRELVRNDDESSDSLNASIRGFRLPESGSYVIVASRFGQQFGFTAGDFDLSITKIGATETSFGLFSQQIAYGTEVSGTINDDSPGFLYTFRGNSGDTISIQMTATSGDLDTRLILTDNLGNTLVSNDDDLLNLTIDALIHSYVLPESGYYSVIATRYSGAPNSGDFQLTVTLDEAGTPGEIHPIYAVLNPENSRTLRADGQYFSNFSAGDSADEDKNELRTDTLLTFFLPPLPEDTQLETATFDLAPCYESGSGFSVLGTLTIYNDNYGLLSERRDFTRPAAGARILAEVDQCGTLDVTEVVRGAYADGTDLQIRLTFRSAISNGQGDEILFTPRLLLTPGE